MKANNSKTFLLFVPCFFLYCKIEAQNIRGDTIFVAASNVVTVYFPSEPSKAQLASGIQDGMYKVNTGAKKSLAILALKEGAENQDLEVTEGDRKHLFILSYKEGSPSRSIDLSSKKILKERSERIKKGVSNALNATNNLYAQAIKDTLNQELWEKVEARYLGLVKVVEPKDGDMVKSRLEESRKQLQVISKDKKYRLAIEEGQRYYSQKKYGEAISAYLRALTEKPEDDLVLKNIQITYSAWTKDYIDKGDMAYNKKKYIDAKMNYQAALEKNPNYPGLQDKFNKVKKDADPLIYTNERKKGDEAMEAYEIEEAQRSYDSALSVRPNDKYITDQLKTLRKREEEIKNEEDREAKYQGILTNAKIMADKASNLQEIDLAIEEYKRALKIFEFRKFPEKKINQLTKLKEKIRAR
jgi:tetratricopeptide (TPR) repeat protein